MKQWLKNAVFYQIYPQSFQDSDGDGIGDFVGITERLDYIKSLGCTAIWMNPCFASSFGDAGYDVTDYYSPAPRYGSTGQLKQLFDEVHKRDMHLVLDLVPGHTSVDCPWFRESMKAEENEYTHRYIWSDRVWNDIHGVEGITGTLRGISDRDGCCAVNYFSCQPALNYGFAKITEPWQFAVDSEPAMATRAEMQKVIRYWLDLGCDGFRIDMAGVLVKNDEGQEQTIQLWKELLGELNRDYPNAVFIAEWGNPERALQGGYDMDFLLHFGPSHYTDMFHCETPYFSPRGIGSAKAFLAYYMDNIRKAAESGGLICIPSGNHDMPRLSYYCDEQQIKLVYAFMMSMPSVPFIYYGDEIGMRYLPGLRSVEGGYDRTGARSPMQWDASKNAGFSEASAEQLYIIQDPDPARPTVQKQAADTASILNTLKELIRVRSENQVLQESGDMTLLCDGYPLVYKRTWKGKSVLVAINPTDTPRTARISCAEPKGVLYSLNGEAQLTRGSICVPPVSASYIWI